LKAGVAALRRCAAAALLLVSGCTGQVSGIVQDAGTGRPVAGVLVELSRNAWGFRDDQLVWDAEKISRSTSDAQGRFAFATDGGTSLRIRAPHYPDLRTSLCPRSPMVVRIGGPYPDLRADKHLFLDPGPSTGGGGAQSANAEDLGLSVSDGTSNESKLELEATGGIRFVAGTGAIPAPPPLPYEHGVTLNPGSACGWLFVSDGASPIAVIQVGGMAWEQEPGGPRRRVLLFTPLPRR
jgi:hypothetical protein